MVDLTENSMVDLTKKFSGRFDSKNSMVDLTDKFYGRFDRKILWSI